MIKAEIKVVLKPGVLDPQGETVKGSLRTLGYDEVEDVRIGKLIELSLRGTDVSLAEKRVVEMCRKLLANPVLETYDVKLTSSTEVPD